MPEGPECQVIVDGLKKITENRQIEKISPVGGRYVSVSIPGLTKEFESVSHPISSVYRHAKSIILELATGNSIIVNLGMTGKFSVEKEKHSAAEFTISGVFDKQKIYFVDQRRFGMIRIIPTTMLSKVLPKIGWDGLSEDLDNSRVQQCLANLKKETIIASAMLNNRVFSGVGNYLRAEILYAAEISPWKNCSDLSKDDVRRLCEQTQRIVRRSYELGGNTIENFSNLSGGSGKFFEELKVYGKKVDSDGNQILTKKTPEGRTIHWCPAKQT